ncbi:MerR family transcriptional regulator [Limosilactobacillus sp. c9Ua_26_M]|uniref:MerR family transcriptional regulator n=1 Tax=Limosilactobacillus urinaemulieris TaxID=2742600 RepID=A0ABR8ZIQ7_9LACO|nr:MerR family transcriptional regulator [Limosilactobacillus urinaemulieris]MBD8085161.1 MerR family transcriptional regulator [Limosilactobacillus urinaemulieris]
MLTSGQLAQRCHTSIRTVQYYDQKGLLHAKRTPSNRRAYDEKDLLRLQQIITYRKLGFKLKDIQRLIENKQTAHVLSSLIDKQTNLLQQQLHQTKSQLEGLKYLKKQLNSMDNFSTKLQEEVLSSMNMTKELHHLRLKLVVWGLIVDILLWGSLIYVVYQGTSIWWFILGFIFSLIICGKITYSYYQHSLYLCPHCHSEFVPLFREWILAVHTPNMKKLTCPHCQQKNFCIEEYR